MKTRAFFGAIFAAILGLAVWQTARGEEIAPTASDCENPINAPIDGLPTSTTTWCTDGFENPVYFPEL